MQDEHKTKEQLMLKAPETQRKRVERGISERRIWLPVAGMFVLLCILEWLNETWDLPHLLLGAPHTPTNWREAIVETVLIAGVGIFAVLRLIRDITERKRAEEALWESEARYRAVVEHQTELICRFLPDATLTFVNDAYCRYFGKKREELIGHSFMPCIPEEDRGGVKVQFTSLSAENPVATYEHRVLTPNGEVCWQQWADRAIFDEQGRLVEFQSVGRDITERKRAEEALQQHTERLRALATQLAEVAEAERQRLARELHDQVGQNLTALGINLNIVRTQLPGETPDPVRSRLDDSLSLVEQTAARIRDVMANLRPPVLDDYGLVAALHWYGEQFARRTDIAVAVEGQEPVPRLAARVENALFRIAQEALTNVAKHAQTTQVTVTVEVEGGTLHLVVADDGVGFDPLTTLSTSPAHLAEPDGDRGWGLLTMTERAEAVGGYCRIESHPSQGTRVIVEVAR